MNILEFKNKLNSMAELGWNEVNTTHYIAQELKESPIKRGFMKGNTGLVYKIGAGAESVLFRADIDALKTSQGVKHTCGHSTHMASLMGAFFYAKEKSAVLTRRNKSIYFLFQPAEETFPSGARTFVAECSTIISQVRSAYSIHVRPQMKLGTIGLQSGSLWARGDYMEIEVKGKMVHIKNNPKGIDAIYASSLIIKGIRAFQSKYSSIRIGIGVISGGRQANTVADIALLKGDIRLPNSTWQIKIKKEINELISKVEQKTKAKIVLHYFDGTPPVINDSETTQNIVNFLKKNTETPFTITTSGLFSYGCEDFAFISERVPSTIALIGTGDLYDLHEENCTISDQGTLKAYTYFKMLIDLHLQS